MTAPMPDLDKAAGVIAGLLDQRPMLDAAPSVIRDIQAKKIAQALASQGLLLPEGFVAVPREPTLEMGLAGADQVNKHMRGPGAPADYDAAKDAYRAMIQAQEKQG